MSLLPTQPDFDPSGGNLDAEEAWKNFGGLTVKQATAKFLESPQRYQEDFMFMGPVAFAFYFPVIDHYLRGVRADPEDWVEYCAAIIGSGVKMQVDRLADKNLPLRGRIAELTTYVRSHLDLLGTLHREQLRIDEAWAAVQTALDSKE